MMFESWRNQLLLSSALAGLALSFGMAGQADADCVQDGITITCSGDLTGDGVVGGVIVVPADVLELNVSNLNAPIMPGAAAAGIRFDRALGDARVITITSAAEISSEEAGTSGIYARSNGGRTSVVNSGDINVRDVGIRVTGPVVGETTVTNYGAINTGRDGIGVTKTDSLEGDITIITRDSSYVTGGNHAISGEFQVGAVGNLTIEASGDLRATGFGINAQHEGSGDVTVTSDATIYARSVGIVAAHSAGAGEVSGTSNGHIESRGSGIQGLHRGAGSITLTSTDTILSGSDGLSVTHTGIESNDVVASGGIDAGANGIDVTQGGGGPVTVTASGNVKAVGVGIRLQFSDDAPVVETNVNLQGGLVEGGTEGIEFVGAGSVGDQANVLTISGAQTNSGGNHDVLGGIGNELIDNRGELTSLGTIDLGGGANRFENRAGSLFNSGDIVDLGAGNPFINAGRVSPFGFGTMGTTAITGNWVGQAGSVLEIDTVLNDGTVDETDVLAVEGNTSGTTLVMVNNLDGEGGQTGQGPTDGIKITDISGASDGSFELVGGFVQAGAFEYGLFQADGQDWYLQTESLSDPAILAPYIAYSLQTFGLKITGTFNERTGTRIGWRPDIMDTSRFSSSADLLGSSLQEPAFEDVVEEASTRFGAWARIIGAWSDANGSLASGFADVSYAETQWAAQAGFDAIISEADHGTLVASAFLHYGQISTNSTNRSTGRAAGSIKTDAWGGGGSLTYATTGGLYFDGVATYTHYDLGVTAGTGAISSTDGDGWTLSGETGWRIALADQIAMTPQAQLVYQDISVGSTTDSTGVLTTFSNTESLEGRLGTTLEFVPALDGTSARLYAEANIVHEFLNDPVATVAGTPLALGFDDTGYEVGLGAEIGQNGGGVAAWINGDYRAPFDANDGIDTWSATGGVTLRF